MRRYFVVPKLGWAVVVDLWTVTPTGHKRVADDRTRKGAQDKADELNKRLKS